MLKRIEEIEQELKELDKPLFLGGLYKKEKLQKELKELKVKLFIERRNKNERN